MKVVIDCEGTPSYTHYIVTKSPDVHYSVLIAKNGKITGNETVKNAKDLVRFHSRYSDAVHARKVKIVRVTQEEFDKIRGSKIVPNSGPKKNKKR
jgi:hypothetical protein